MLTHADVEYLINKLSEGVNIITADMTKEQITESLNNHLKLHNENLIKQVFRANFQAQNN
jgi:hypothetical protein